MASALAQITRPHEFTDVILLLCFKSKVSSLQTPIFIRQAFSQFSSVDWNLVIPKYSTLSVSVVISVMEWAKLSPFEIQMKEKKMPCIIALNPLIPPANHTVLDLCDDRQC